MSVHSTIALEGVVYVALEHFVSRGDCLLEQAGGADVWPERCPVAMGISGVVVYDCRLGGSRARGKFSLALATLDSGRVLRLRKSFYI